MLIINSIFALCCGRFSKMFNRHMILPFTLSLSLQKQRAREFKTQYPPTSGIIMAMTDAEELELGGRVVLALDIENEGSALDSVAAINFRCMDAIVKRNGLHFVRAAYQGLFDSK